MKLRAFYVFITVLAFYTLYLSLDNSHRQSITEEHLERITMRYNKNFLYLNDMLTNRVTK